MANKNPMTIGALRRMLESSIEKVGGSLDTTARYKESLGDAYSRRDAPIRSAMRGQARRMRDRSDSLRSEYTGAMYGQSYKSPGDLYEEAFPFERDPQSTTGLPKGTAGRESEGLQELWERKRKEADIAYAGRQKKGGDYLRDIPREHGLTDLKPRRLLSEADKIALQAATKLRSEGQRLGTATRGGRYLGIPKGGIRHTLPQSTGSLNGVMRGLAGLFILFIFISVFYMVFGPLYDVLITNFLLIAGADGSTMLGGKDIATLYANTANAILIWVPLTVIGGTLYLLISMVFERESKGLAGANIMTEWDVFGGMGEDEDLNLDIALDGGMDDPMGFYGPS